MILAIESSLPTFKTIYFHDGINVLLADTRPGHPKNRHEIALEKPVLSRSSIFYTEPTAIPTPCFAIRR